MRILLQRVKQASVVIDGQEAASIGLGVLLLAGFSQEDGLDLPRSPIWNRILGKIPELRIFPDQEGKSNLSLREVEGDLLAVSQFTLYADCRKGRRPSFVKAAPAKRAQELYISLIKDLKELYPGHVLSGSFGSEMDISYCNWGPVSIILDSEYFG